MKRYLLPYALVVAALTQTVHASQGELADLKDLIWQNRIIVANSEQSSDQLTELFSQENSGIIDRDVIWFVFLIGKDGGLKERISGLDLDRLFGDIDRMPMRVREMRE